MEALMIATYTVKCRRCGQDMKISAADRADMLINGGGVSHVTCPKPGDDQ